MASSPQGLVDYFNALTPNYPGSDYANYLNSPFARKALHVGSGAVFWDYNATVEKNLINDWMQPVTSCVSTLLNANRYRVLFYNGQEDIIVSFAGTSLALANLEWNGSDLWGKAPKQIWKRVPAFTDSDIFGYARVQEPLTHVVVRGAGHMVTFQICCA